MPGEVKEGFLEEVIFELNHEKARSHLTEIKVKKMYPRQMEQPERVCSENCECFVGSVGNFDSGEVTKAEAGKVRS